MDPMLQTKLTAAGLYLVVVSILVVAHYRPRMRNSRMLGVNSFFTVLASLTLTKLWWPGAYSLKQRLLIALATSVLVYVLDTLVQRVRHRRHELRTFKLGEPEDGEDAAKDECNEGAEDEDAPYRPPAEPLRSHTPGPELGTLPRRQPRQPTKFDRF